MGYNRNILVTCGRFHPSTGIVRAMHSAGARVDVVDSYRLSPALHSRGVDQMHVVRPPAPDPIKYAQDIAEIVRKRQIDLVMPIFEDGFYLARYADLIPAPLFSPPFETIARLHDKSRFVGLCQDLGLYTPRTEVVASRDDLRSAISRFGQFVARPAFSRGGLIYLTNHGPRAGEIAIDGCEPTDENPWLVQEYIDGTDACSLSIVREGEVVVHCAYEPTVPAPGGYSVQFSTVGDFGSLEMVSKVCAETNYTGFVGFDFRRSPDGLVMIECNPRSSVGVFLQPDAWIGDAVLGEAGDLRIVEAGVRRQCDAYMLNRHIVKMPARQLVHELLTTPDLYMSADDMLPAIYFFMNQRHWSHIAKREHISLSEAYLGDVSWDGSPMPDQSATAVGGQTG